jgi:hypothetical protein
MVFIDYVNQYSPIGSLMAGIGALVGCWFAIRSNSALKEQVKNGYRPFLVPLETKYDLFTINLNRYLAIREDAYKESFYRNFKDTFIDEGASVIENFMEGDKLKLTFPISLLNVGNNIAQKAEVSWIWDKEETLKIISHMNNVAVEEDDGRFMISYCGEMASLFFSDIEEQELGKDRIGVLLPHNITQGNNIAEIDIPYLFIEMYYMYNYIMSNQLDDSLTKENGLYEELCKKIGKDQEVISTIKMLLKYEDIAGNKYSKHYNLRISEEPILDYFLAKVKNIHTYRLIIEED